MASPISLAAMDAPTMIDRFGAMKDIRDSTYSKILALHSVRSTAYKKYTAYYDELFNQKNPNFYIVNFNGFM